MHSNVVEVTLFVGMQIMSNKLLNKSIIVD